MTTSKHLTLPLFPDWELTPPASTSYTPASRARTSQSRAKAEALKASEADCGGKRCGSCANCDPVGFALRTSLACAVAELTQRSATWRRQATPAGRSWWVLTTLDSDTGASASGFSRSVAAASARSDWATPVSTDANQVPYQGKKARPFPRLLGQAQKAWPTPSASVANDGEGAATWEARIETLKAKKINGNGAGMPLSIAVQKHWQTPTAGLADAGCTSRGGKRKGELLLSGQVLQSQKDWPTPTARDHRSIHASPVTMDRNSRPLSEFVGAQSSQDQASPNSPGKPRGYLNPEWVLQLMGLPRDWLPVTAVQHFELSATPSAQTTRKRSDERY